MVASDGSMDDLRTIDRRTVLNALGLASAGISTGLAGCGEDSAGGSPGGGGEDTSPADDSELGERVPTVIFEWWNNFTPARFNELSAPSVVEDIERVGLSVDQAGVGALDILSKQREDTRELHIANGFRTPTDVHPFDLFERYTLFNAGANGQSNGANFANCDFEDVYQEVKRTIAEDRLEELTFEGNRIINEETPVWNLVQFSLVNVLNTEQITPRSLGQIGVMYENTRFWVNSEANNDGNNIIVNAIEDVANSPIQNLIGDSGHQQQWNGLIYSPLLELDENSEIGTSLAEDWELSDDETEITVTLSGGTFHNGEPITVEDIKFTWEFYRENFTLYPDGIDMDLETVEIVDDETVVFTTSQPDPVFLTKGLPVWGILPKDIYEAAGAWENPDSFDPREAVDDDDLVLVGSGPFKVSELTVGQSLHLEPWDGHPVHRPNSNILMPVFDAVDSAVRAFDQGDINVLRGIPNNQATDYEGSDRYQINVTEGFTFGSFLQPQNSFPPFQFRELRRAVNYVFDRERISEVATAGYGKPYSASVVMSGLHPYFDVGGLEDLRDGGFDVPPVEGDVDEARQILEDAGWGWDEDGRLHYPPDVDLAPRWPEGSEPQEHPERYPCVEDYKG